MTKRLLAGGRSRWFATPGIKAGLGFGAIAGQGHCYAQLGDLRRARECYRRALEVNPRMEGVAEAYAQLKDAPL